MKAPEFGRQKPRTQGRGSRYPCYCQRLAHQIPSPPAPLPHGGEGRTDSNYSPLPLGGPWGRGCPDLSGRMRGLPARLALSNIPWDRTLADFTASGDAPAAHHLLIAKEKNLVVHVDAGADVVGNHGEGLTHVEAVRGFCDVQVAVLFVEFD